VRGAGTAAERILGDGQQAQVDGRLDILDHPLADESHLAAVLDRHLGHERNACDRRGEAGDQYPAGCPLEDLLEGRPHALLISREARLFDVGAVRQQGEDASLAPGGQRRSVGSGSGGGRAAQLEVAGQDDRATRGLDHEPAALGYGMSHLHRVQAERTKLDRLTWGELVEVAAHVPFAQASPGQGQRVAAAIDARGG
jgi:hypothetical protein